MKMTSTLCAAAVLAGSLQLAFAADITGKVTLKGAPPPEREIPMDASCGKLHSGKVMTKLYNVGKDGALADVLVYIKDGLSGKTFEVQAKAAELDQKGCEYIPYVFALQTKQKLMVKNSDPLLHNVHVTPAVAGNKESNKAQMAGAKPFEYAFDAQEIFLRFKCDVHPWMFAYAGVLDHPFSAVTDKEGNFTIKNVPPGKYTVEAVHRKTHTTGGKGLSKEVEVKDDGAKADFVVEVK